MMYACVSVLSRLGHSDLSLVFHKWNCIFIVMIFCIHVAESLNAACLQFCSSIFIDMFVVGVYALPVCAFLLFTVRVGFKCLLVATLAQYPSVMFASYCDDCSINLGAHRELLRPAHCSLSRWLVAELCIAVESPIHLAKRRLPWRLFKGIIYLS